MVLPRHRTASEVQDCLARGIALSAVDSIVRLRTDGRDEPSNMHRK